MERSSNQAERCPRAGPCTIQKRVRRSSQMKHDERVVSFLARTDDIEKSKIEGRRERRSS